MHLTIDSFLAMTPAERSQLQEFSLRGEPNGLRNLEPARFQALCRSLEQCKSLQIIDLCSVGLGELSVDDLQNLFSAISNNTQLRKLDLSCNDIRQDADLPKLFSYLERFTNIQNLDLSIFSCELNPTGLQALCQVLRKYTHLQKFKFSSNSNFDPIILRDLFTAMTGCTQLQKLNLSQTIGKLDLASAQALGNALAQYPNLQSLDLRNSGLGNLATPIVQVLFDAIGKCTRLQVLDLSSNLFYKLDNIGVQALRNALAQCLSLQKLDLCSNNIGDLAPSSLQNLFTAMARYTQLQDLNLSLNNLYKLNRDSVQALCRAIEQYSNLQILQFDHNELGKLNTMSLQDLFNAMARCTQLQHLNLYWNNLYQLDVNSVRALGNALRQYQNLQVLKLDCNDLGHAPEFMAICEGLRQCSNNLRVLDLFSNYFRNLGEARFLDLCGVLGGRRNLHCLNLACNDLGSLQSHLFQSLCSALANCINLKSLNLQNNNFDRLEINSIPALSWLTRLQELDLSNNNLSNLDKPRLEALFATLAQCSGVLELGLCHNKFYRLDAERLLAFSKLVQERLVYA